MLYTVVFFCFFFYIFFFFQVRTLFVSGLPVDIKPRELYLLFRPFKVSMRLVSEAMEEFVLHI